MTTGQGARRTIRAGLGTMVAISACLLVSGVAAQNRSATPAESEQALRVLDRWIGRWQVTVTTTRPEPSVVTSTTTNSWTLDKRFIQGDSGVKSDGTRDMSMLGFEAVSRAYPLWIFNSSGVVFYLADGQ